MLSRASILCGFVILVGAGCRTYSPYGCGTAGCCPGPMTMPSSPYPPSGPILTPSSPTTFPQGSTPQGFGSNAPPYNPGTTTPTGNVPNYPDPNGPSAQKAKQNQIRDDFENSNEQFNDKSLESKKLRDMEEDTGGNNSSYTPKSDDEFESPTPFKAIVKTSGESFDGDGPETGVQGNRPNPYLHDAKSYSWLRGIASYDEDEQVWYLIYNPDPDENDKYKGSIALADHPTLSALQQNEVYLVEGKVDSEQDGRYGKPKYVIQVIHHLVPDNQDS